MVRKRKGNFGGSKSLLLKKHRPNESHDLSSDNLHKRKTTNNSGHYEEKEEILSKSFHHPVLSYYFPRLVPLREYLLHLLAKRSKHDKYYLLRYQQLQSFQSDGSIVQERVESILNGSLVGLVENIEFNTIAKDELYNSLKNLKHIHNQPQHPLSSQNDVVELIIAKLFTRLGINYDKRLKSILIHGYQEYDSNIDHELYGIDSRLNCQYVNTAINPYIAALKGPIWRRIMEIVGEAVFMEVFTIQGEREGGVFMPISTAEQEEHANKEPKCFYQIAGSPICEIKWSRTMLDARAKDFQTRFKNVHKIDLLLNKGKQSFTANEATILDTHPHQPAIFKQGESSVKVTSKKDLHGANQIVFQRSRIFYAKPTNNQKDKVKFQLRHIHVLNRFSNHKLRAHRVHVTKYIFPREFGLHNAFTSHVDRNTTTQRFKDYTLREEEITKKCDLLELKFLEKNKPLDAAEMADALEVPRPKDVSRVPVEDENEDTEEDSAPEVVETTLENSFGLNGLFKNSIMQSSARTRKKSVQQTSSRTQRAAKQKWKLERIERHENVPKRLRGNVLEMVGLLIKNQDDCQYDALIRHYCPAIGVDVNAKEARSLLPASQASSKYKHSTLAASQFTPSLRKNEPVVLHQNMSGLTDQTGIPDLSFKDYDESLINFGKKRLEGDEYLVDFASCTGNVSAFVRAVLRNIIPKGFWGLGDVGVRHEKLVFDKVDKFIKLRRNENMCLHEVLQDIKITAIGWLGPTTSTISPSDIQKRRSLFSEWLYYVFDSLVIPIIQTHFYVTESTRDDKMRVFYFRHDLWRSLTEPKFNILKQTTYEEVIGGISRKDLDKRAFDHGVIRLLPKDKGIRTITNLKRKVPKTVLRGGKPVSVLESINQKLQPIRQALKYEKDNTPEVLGATIFSHFEVVNKLRLFKERLRRTGILGKEKLYFAKVDITAAFDTLPQNTVWNIVKPLFRHEVYNSRKINELRSENDPIKKYPRIKYEEKAKPPDDDFSELEDLLSDRMMKGPGEKQHTVYVDKVTEKAYNKDVLLKLLEEHITDHIVKIGKKFYRQRFGIPQGSCLSGLLCNLVYADLEAKYLSFTRENTGILLRLTDDFLFITLSRSNAQKFLQIMHAGLSDYGAQVKLEKSLANFEISINDMPLKRVDGLNEGFPYAGFAIDQQSLDIKRDRNRNSNLNIADTLTVVYSNEAGNTMVQKMVKGFKMTVQGALIDPTYNSRRTVLANVFTCFMDSGMRMYRYCRAVSRTRTIHSSLVKKIINEIVDATIQIVRSYERKGGAQSRKINKAEIMWLAACAYRRILHKKQTNFTEVISWLDHVTRSVKVDRLCRSLTKDPSVLDPLKGYRY